MALWLRTTTGVTTIAERFDELSVDLRYNVIRRIGQTLRGNTFDHLKSKHRVWVVIISADETFGLTSTKRDFLHEFWYGASREVVFDASMTEPGSGWINVATEGGETPFENVEGNRLMPEFTFALIEKGAS